MVAVSRGQLPRVRHNPRRRLVPEDSVKEAGHPKNHSSFKFFILCGISTIFYVEVKEKNWSN